MVVVEAVVAAAAAAAAAAGGGRGGGKLEVSDLKSNRSQIQVKLEKC